MKKIILSMAMLAMVGATATAQEDNDGLTASRYGHTNHEAGTSYQTAEYRCA